MFRQSLRVGSFQGVWLGRMGPLLTHLLFIDDCMIFGPTTTEGVSTVQGILHEYGRCSGQLVNFDKSSVTFSSNVHLANSLAFGTKLGVRVVSKMDRNLGLPPMIDRRKRETF